MDGTIGIIINASTLLAVAGIGVRIWLAGRTQNRKIGPQPFEISHAPDYARAGDCRDYRADNENDHQNLFARMSAAEQRIAANEATVVEIRTSIQSIDAKMTRLLRSAGPEITE